MTNSYSKATWNYFFLVCSVSHNHYDSKKKIQSFTLKAQAGWYNSIFEIKINESIAWMSKTINIIQPSRLQDVCNPERLEEYYCMYWWKWAWYWSYWQQESTIVTDCHHWPCVFDYVLHIIHEASNSNNVFLKSGHI